MEQPTLSEASEREREKKKGRGTRQFLSSFFTERSERISDEGLSASANVKCQAGHVLTICKFFPVVKFDLIWNFEMLIFWTKKIFSVPNYR